MFHRFRAQFLPSLSDLFDEGFWTIVIPQAAQVYASVWHAAVATATMKSLVLMKTSGNDPMSQYQKDSLHVYALKHCNIAIQYLTKTTYMMASATDGEMLLLACILLICFSTLCGNHGEALAHTHSGLRLCKEWQEHCEYACDGSESQRLSSCLTTTMSIKMRLRRLQILMFLARVDLPHSEARAYYEPVQRHTPFVSPAEAYLELLSIDSTWKRLVISDTFPGGQLRLQFKTNELHSLRLPFQTWQRRFHALRASKKPFTSRAGNAQVSGVEFCRYWGERTKVD